MGGPDLREAGAMSESATSSVSVVVGVDGSEHGNSALNWALTHVVRRGGGEIRAVMCWHYPAMAAAGYPLGGGLPPSDSMADATTDALADVISELDIPDGVTVTQVVREGAAASALIEEASDADLIVVGKRGHGGFLGLLMGSVANQVANHAECPVVIVPS